MWMTAGVFFASPAKAHYLIGIGRRIGLSHTSVKNNLIRLAKLGIIEKAVEQKGKRKFPVYRARIGDRLFREHKRIYNLVSFLESGVAGFLEGKLAPKAMVLFGSYERGEDIEGSDIDVFVECRRESVSLEKFEKLLQRKIELHFNEQFASYPKELKNNIINGIVVSGFLEGYP